MGEIKAIDEPESAVNSAVTAVENCCTRPKTYYTFMCVTPDIQIIQPHENIIKVGVFGLFAPEVLLNPDQSRGAL